MTAISVAPTTPVLVETYKDTISTAARLNQLAADPTNRYDLKFVTEGASGYTLFLIWVPFGGE